MGIIRKSKPALIHDNKGGDDPIWIRVKVDHVIPQAA
jgi:hypothetical protein